MSNTATKVEFFTVEEFKAKMGLTGEKSQVVRNPNKHADGTNKLFLSIGSSSFKCQQAIDPKKEMKVLVENGDYSAGCLTNIKETANNVVFSV